MVEGGKYNILNIIQEYINHTGQIRFTTKDIQEKTELCQQSVGQNISRLVNSGFLIKHEYYSRSKKHRVVDYTINPEALSIIKELFD